MIIEETKRYQLKCDFCNSEYEKELPPGPDSPEKAEIRLTYGSIELWFRPGHMCNECYDKLYKMWETRQENWDAEKAKSDEWKAEAPEPTPKTEKTCKTCSNCCDRQGKGRGTQYKCGLSGAWFLNGLGCDAWFGRPVKEGEHE